eukprot:5641826-Amphidinium_carterae.1
MLTARDATHRGGEVRLQIGELSLPPKSPWASFNCAAFQWRVFQSYPWHEGARHINYLELLAVLNFCGVWLLTQPAMNLDFCISVIIKQRWVHFVRAGVLHIC